MEFKKIISLFRLKRSINLRTQLALSFSALTSLVVGATISILYVNFRSEIRQELRLRAIDIVAVAALQQNGDEFEQIKSGQDLLHEKFRIQNLKIRRIDPDIEYVFTATKDDDGLFFVVDAGEPGEENIAQYGERYEEPSELLIENYDTMTSAIADPDIYTDAYGSFISSYAPIFTSDGRRVGVIGVDFTAATVVAKERQFLWLSLVVFLLTLPFVILFGLFLGNGLAAPISTLADMAHEFAAGGTSSRVEIKSSVIEIVELAKVFNMMTDTVSDLIEGLEKRVVERTSSAENARVAAESARKNIETQVWLATGQTQLADVLRGEQTLSQLAENVITQVCQYTGAQAGALFVLNEKTLTLVGRYAYTDRPGFAGSFQLGEGLVGQAAADGKVMYVDVIPSDTLVISTGLADMKPRQLAAAPFYMNGNVVGVMELATLSAFTRNHLELWDRISETIGSAFHTVQTRQRLARLLMESQAQSEELQAQEEELRAANEELQAQAENLKAKKEETRLTAVKGI
jgi:methyl-accepting chemotaxis protein